MQVKYEPLVLEPEILAFWEKNKIYEKQKAKGKKGKKFYYLDGPPYTSGKVHVGTAWGKSLRDAIIRYKKMQGFNVWDRAGFDTHGLPTEHAVQKKFGIKSKEEIAEKFGVEKFSTECLKLAEENMTEMIKDFKRIGAWLEWTDPYVTYQENYIDAVWWIIKKAHEQNLIYEGLKVMTWCPHCATAVAKHELEYQNVTEDSVFLKFKIQGKKDEYLIVWTTTPWTIPFNLAVMVNPELKYVKAKVGDETWIVAKALAGVFSGLISRKFDILEEFTGDKLEGIRYDHPLLKQVPYLKEIDDKYDWAHKVLLSTEYVDTSAGTGLVHCAPGCGPEDQEVGARYKLPPFNELDERGVFSEKMGSYKGWTAKKDDLKFISEFEKLGFLIISTKVDHEYAHCSRCHGAVVFRATKQWFMKVEHMKEELIKANQKINWVPDWGGNRWFDSWLRNLQDSSISRQRYWGTPLPFWKCEKCGELTVVGSIKELKKLSGKLPSNLHKPWIDKVTMKCKCGGKKIRTPDILDVWLDAACASWACLYYPAKDKFLKSYFPADLILEGKDQIRGWFNVLSTIGWIGFKQIPFKACYMHGMINDAQGRKMSKSLGNYILPEEVIGKYGADTMRYYMIQAANPGLDLNYNLEDTKTKYRLLEVLWNTHIYLINYSKSEGIDPTKLKNPKLATEEKYILSRSNSTIQKVTELYDAYHINEVPGEIEALFLDVSRKYIQIIRDKLAAGTKEEKEAVIFTLYNILTDILKMFATVAPFATEQMYQNLKEAFGLKEESVHLLSWPKANKKLINKKIEEEFVAADKLISEILSAREKLQRNVRWPIKSITVYVPHEVKEYKALIKQIDSQEEIIKRITNTMDIEATDKQIKGITKTVKPDYEKLAPRFKKDIAEVISKIVQMSPESILKKIEEKGKFEITLQSGLKAEIKSEDFITDLGLPKNIFAVKSNNYTVYLNTEETSDILSLGFAREITRKVQALRKKAGLQKQDRIKLTIEASPELKALLEKNLNEISVKTGLDGLDFNKVGKQKFSEGFKIRDEEIAIGFDFVTKK